MPIALTSGTGATTTRRPLSSRCRRSVEVRLRSAIAEQDMAFLLQGIPVPRAGAQESVRRSDPSPNRQASNSEAQTTPMPVSALAPV